MTKKFIRKCQLFYVQRNSYTSALGSMKIVIILLSFIVLIVHIYDIQCDNLIYIFNKFCSIKTR